MRKRRNIMESIMIKVVHSKLLRGWFVVRGPHHTPLTGKFETKGAALAWLERKSK